MPGSSSRPATSDHRPVTADADEKIAVDSEYSHLPEVVVAHPHPHPPPASFPPGFHQQRQQQSQSPYHAPPPSTAPPTHFHPPSSFGPPPAQAHSFHPPQTSIVSPLTPQPPAFLPPHPVNKPSSPWSPASFANLHSAPPPYAPSEPPSPNPSHIRLHGGQGTWGVQQTDQQPFLAHQPAPPNGGLGPVAAQRRRTRIKWVLFGGLVLLLFIGAVVVGILVGVVHVKFGGAKDDKPATVAPGSGPGRRWEGGGGSWERGGSLWERGGSLWERLVGG